MPQVVDFDVYDRVFRCEKSFKLGLPRTFIEGRTRTPNFTLGRTRTRTRTWIFSLHRTRTRTRTRTWWYNAINIFLPKKFIIIYNMLNFFFFNVYFLSKSACECQVHVLYFYLIQGCIFCQNLEKIPPSPYCDLKTFPTRRGNKF